MAGYYWVDFIIFGGHTCPACRREKPRNSEHFHLDNHEPDGLTRECKACRCSRGTRRYAADPAYRDKKLAQMRASRARTVGT